jgi:hypothetical protein
MKKKALLELFKTAQNGIADNPMEGCGKIIGVDLDSYSGAFKPNPRPVNKIASVFTPSYFTKTTDFYLAVGNDGSNGFSYKSTTGATWEVNTGYGTSLMYGTHTWQNHQFIFHSTAIDIFLPGGTYSNAWAGLTLTASTYHPAYTAQNGTMYIGGNYVLSSLAPIGGFAPGTGGTYTATAVALSLPQDRVIYGIQELGDFLFLMTNNGIFKWNKSDPSFNRPIFSNGTAYGGLTISGLLYFIGKENTGGGIGVYVTNGSSIQKLKEIPLYLYDYITNGIANITPYQEAIGFQDGNILWNTAIGVFSYNIKTGRLTIDNWGSIGDPGTGYTTAGGLWVINHYKYLFGYKNSTTYYLDLVDYGTGTATYGTSLIESPLFDVGEEFNKGSLGNLEAFLYKPMSATSGFKTQYRTNLGAGWTDIKTIDYATNSTAQSVAFPSKVFGASKVQFRLLLDNYNSTNGPIIEDIKAYGNGKNTV